MLKKGMDFQLRYIDKEGRSDPNDPDYVIAVWGKIFEGKENEKGRIDDLVITPVSRETRRQINALAEMWGSDEHDVVWRCIDRIYFYEKQRLEAANAK